MALNDNRDDNLERDPQLVQLYQAAAGEEPPAALDAAILAAARRETGAGLQVVGGAGDSAGSSTGRKRSWYMPVSIAAVVVLSVSLVTVVQQEKGDELAQPPSPATAPPALSTPAKPDATQGELAPPAATVTPQPRDDAAQVPVAPAAIGEIASKQRSQKEAIEAKSLSKQAPAEPQRKEERAGESAALSKADPTAQARREVPAGGVQNRQIAPTPGVAAAGDAAGTQAATPVAPPSERRPEPFAAASEREAAAQASKDTAASGRARSEADRAATRSTAPEPPAAAVTAPVPPRPASVAEDKPVASAPPPAEPRMRSVPPPAVTGAAPVQRRSAPLPAQRPAWLIELANQPPEKWLEKLAEFKRDGRQADADALMVEFRQRFPDHPVSVR
jgi:hypothetical protein